MGPEGVRTTGGGLQLPDHDGRVRVADGAVGGVRGEPKGELYAEDQNKRMVAPTSRGKGHIISAGLRRRRRSTMRWYQKWYA